VCLVAQFFRRGRIGTLRQERGREPAAFRVVIQRGVGVVTPRRGGHTGKTGSRHLQEDFISPVTKKTTLPPPHGQVALLAWGGKTTRRNETLFPKGFEGPLSLFPFPFLW